MGYFYLLCVALMFSFGGTFVRLIKPYYSSSYSTWFRFLMGVLFLVLLKFIKPQFPETDLDKLTMIVERYQKQDTWKKDTIFQKDSFDLLQNILEEAGELEERVPYEDLVTTEYARKAAGK